MSFIMYFILLQRKRTKKKQTLLNKVIHKCLNARNHRKDGKNERYTKHLAIKYLKWIEVENVKSEIKFVWTDIVWDCDNAIFLKKDENN